MSPKLWKFFKQLYVPKKLTFFLSKNRLQIGIFMAGIFLVNCKITTTLKNLGWSKCTVFLYKKIFVQILVVSIYDKRVNHFTDVVVY